MDVKNFIRKPWKRGISLFLIFAMVLSCFSCSNSKESAVENDEIYEADDAKEDAEDTTTLQDRSAFVMQAQDGTDVFATVLVKQDDIVRYSVIVRDDDLLFTGEDLAQICGYLYEDDGMTARFTRGSKVVEVDLETGAIHPMTNLAEDLSSLTWTTSLTRYGDCFYYSGANLFPWLNVECGVQDGMLLVICDGVSIWDFIEEYAEQDLMFDFIECCEMLGLNEAQQTALIAEAYVLSNGTKIILDGVPVAGTTYSYGEYDDYYSALETLFEDKSSYLSDVQALMKEAKNVKTSYSMMQAIGDADILPDSLTATMEIISGFAKLGDYLDYALYYDLFNQDNEMKLALMQAICDTKDEYDYPDVMVDAAIVLKNSYENLWYGVGGSVLTSTIETIVTDGLKAAAGAAGSVPLALLTAINWVGSTASAELKNVNKIWAYDNIACYAYDAWRDNRGAGDYQSIMQQVCQSQTYLFFTANCWEIMSAYAKDKFDGQYEDEDLIRYNADIADAIAYFDEKSEQANYWQARFVLAYSSIGNDAWDYAKTADRDYLLEEVFPALILQGMISSEFASVEYGILLTALEDMGYSSIYWLVTDADGDGTDEFFAQLVSDKDTYMDYLVAADASSGLFWSVLANDKTFCTISSRSGLCYFEKYYVGDWQLEMMYQWSKAGWYEIGYLESDFFNAATGSFDSYTAEWEGISITEDEFWNEKMEDYEFAYLDCQDVQSVWIDGDPEELTSQLTAYFSNRYGTWAVLEEDMDQDGVVEPIYFVGSPASLWLGQIDAGQVSMLRGAALTDPTLTVYEDNRTVAVCVQPAEGGVYVQSSLLLVSGEDKTLMDLAWIAEEGLVLIDDVTYWFDGGTLIPAGSTSVTVLDLLQMDYQEAVSHLESYDVLTDENGLDYVWGYMGSTIVELQFRTHVNGAVPSDSPVLEVHVIDVMGDGSGGFSFTTLTAMGMPLSQLRSAFTPCTEWSNIRYDGQVPYVRFLYAPDGTEDIYYVYLYLSGDTEDSVVVEARFINYDGATDAEKAELGR